MTVFFTGDTHFGHGGARGLFRRPFASTAEMDEAMIRAWNDVVGERDVVWHLGDFAVRPSSARLDALLGALAGTKHLLIGNNETESTLAHPGFASVQHYAEMELDGRQLVLCHYPFRSWNRMAQRAINLHGHCHGRLKPMTRQIDVGVDVWDFRPVTLDAIRDALRRRARGRDP